MTPAQKRLLKAVDTAEDRLNRLVTRLWVLVDPSSDEIEEVTSAMAWHNDNNNPTDLEILRAVLSGDRE